MVKSNLKTIFKPNSIKIFFFILFMILNFSRNKISLSYSSNLLFIFGILIILMFISLSYIMGCIVGHILNISDVKTTRENLRKSYFNIAILFIIFIIMTFIFIINKKITEPKYALTTLVVFATIVYFWYTEHKRSKIIK